MRLRLARPLALLLALGASSHALADPRDAATYSLDDALRVLARHPILKSAEATIDAARADRVSAKLWTNPTVGATYTKGVAHSSYAERGYVTYGLTQQIELSNAPGARGRAAELGIAAARADFDGLRLSLSLDVEEAFIALAATQRKVSLAERAVALLDHAATVVGQRVAAGAAPRYDAARIAVTTAAAHAELSSLRADAVRAEAELRAAVGPGSEALHGTATFPLEGEAILPSPDQLVTDLSRRRPDIEAARQRAAAAQATITAAKRGVFPGVAVSVLGGVGAAPGQVDVGAGLTVPLPVVDRGQGSVVGAKARAAEAMLYVDAVLVPARLRIEGMHAEVMTRRQALAEYHGRAVTSGDELLTEAQAGYGAGRFSILELVDAYIAWREARMRAVDLAAAARMAEVDLSREAGQRLTDQSTE